MAEKSMFFDANLVNGVYDRTYLSEEFSKYLGSLVRNGVFALEGNIRVDANSGMNINVTAGKAWINGRYYENTDNFSITVPIADGLLNRIDRVVLRLDLSVRAINLALISGVPASNPVPPDLTRTDDIYELCLANVRINAGVTEITQSNITDTRPDAELCGEVRSIIDKENDGVVPPGGTTDQFLMKQSNADYDLKWQTNYTVPPGGTKDQIISKSSSINGDYKWIDKNSVINYAIGDWNIAAETNGIYDTLLRPGSLNAPVSTGAALWYSVTYNYATEKTQLAIPFRALSEGTYIRFRYSNVWTKWYKYCLYDPDGDTPLMTSDKGKANGVASLDSNSQVMQVAGTGMVNNIHNRIDIPLSATLGTASFNGTMSLKSVGGIVFLSIFGKYNDTEVPIVSKTTRVIQFNKGIPDNYKPVLIPDILTEFNFFGTFSGANAEQYNITIRFNFSQNTNITMYVRNNDQNAQNTNQQVYAYTSYIAFI